MVKPQQTKEYWTEERRKQHSERMKNSPKYYEAIKNRDTSGINNSMYGKKLSEATKQKMSKARTGKVGKDATAWKGGKDSLNKRVRKSLHERYNWYRKVYQRDQWKCVRCNSTIQLDAHHIKPLTHIIKELLSVVSLTSDDEKLLWLMEQPTIIDIELTNGITLCRECHRKEHGTWGSHKPKIV